MYVKMVYRLSCVPSIVNDCTHMREREGGKTEKRGKRQGWKRNGEGGERGRGMGRRKG